MSCETLAGVVDSDGNYTKRRVCDQDLTDGNDTPRKLILKGCSKEAKTNRVADDGGEP